MFVHNKYVTMAIIPVYHSILTPYVLYMQYPIKATAMKTRE